MSERPNIVLITVDDMNWDSIGAYGSPVAEATPNIDHLALKAFNFSWARQHSRMPTVSFGYDD